MLNTALGGAATSVSLTCGVASIAAQAAQACIAVSIANLAACSMLISSVGGDKKQ